MHSKRWIGLALVVGVAAMAFPAAGQLSGTPFGGTYNGSESTMGYLLHGGLGQVSGKEFGMIFNVPTDVVSVNFLQGSGLGPGRSHWKKIDVYADGQLVGYIDNLPKVQDHTNLAIYSYETDAPTVLEGVTWVALVFRDSWGDGAINTAGLLNGFSFNGTPVADAGPVNVDVNLGKTYTSSHQSGSGVYSYSPTAVTNGSLMPAEGTLWERSSLGTDDRVSLTVNYGVDEDGEKIRYDMDRVGIALASTDPNRIAPRWVWISSDKDAPVQIFLDDALAFYNQYDLPAGGFLGINTLTITFPKPYEVYEVDEQWVSAWYNSYQNYFGLTEFQAFGSLTPIPEPATMSLLALGGLAMLRRRR